MSSTQNKNLDSRWDILRDLDGDLFSENITISEDSHRIIDDKKFFREALELAENLIGKILVRVTDEGITMVRINETEAYLGLIDDACHSYGGKVTSRNSTLYKEEGTIYVYLIYGMYDCFNIVAGNTETPTAVLIRGGIPVYNMPLLTSRRFKDPEMNSYRKRNFMNGPGKFCLANGIDRTMNGRNILMEKDIFLLDDGKKYDHDCTPRIGIDYAHICKDRPWRFLMRNGN